MELKLNNEQQKLLFDRIFYKMKDLHSEDPYDTKLKEFISDKQFRKWKGFVLLNYTCIEDMITSLREKKFNYEWVKVEQAKSYRLANIPYAVASMNTKTDCVFVCRLELNLYP